jgi:PsbP-like protein
MKLFRHLRILIQCFFVVAFLLGCSQTNEAVETTEFIEYVDKSNQYAFSYPKDWIMDTNQKDVEVMIGLPKESDQNVISESLAVKAVPLPFEATSDKVTNSFKILK